MTSFQEYCDELEYDYIVIELGDTVLKKIGLDTIQEGHWVDSFKKGWSQRVEPANPQINLQRHVHIARKKHINTKNQQVAWNQDGTRHDKKTFNPNLSGINTAKQIARDAIGLGPDIILEHLSKARQLILLCESFSDVTSTSPFEPIYLSLELKL